MEDRKLERLAELYQKLKGSIFLRLCGDFLPSGIYESDVKKTIYWEEDTNYPRTLELKREMSFEDFLQECRNFRDAK